MDTNTAATALNKADEAHKKILTRAELLNLIIIYERTKLAAMKFLKEEARRKEKDSIVQLEFTDVAKDQTIVLGKSGFADVRGFQISLLIHHTYFINQKVYDVILPTGRYALKKFEHCISLAEEDSARRHLAIERDAYM